VGGDAVARSQQELGTSRSTEGVDVKKSGWFRWLVLLSVFAIVAAACSDEGDGGGETGTATGSETGAETGSTGGGLIVGFIPTTTNTYIAEWARGAQEEAAALGYELKLIENNFDQAEQDTQVQQQLGSGEEVVAYAWWPSDNAAGVASLTALNESGVPVIQTNQTPYAGTEELVVGYAGVNDTFNGEVAAGLVVEARDALAASGATLHSDGGNAVIVGFVPGYQAGIDRSAAAVPILEAAGINVLGQVDVGFDPTTGYEGMNELIAAYQADGIDLVYAHNSSLAEGVIQALEEAGYTPGEDVMVVGGTCHGNLENLESGKEFATGLQAAYLEGVFSVDALDEYLSNGSLAEYFNFIPNPPVHGDEIDTVTIDGAGVRELCVY
jgi:ribose transport system substrate-binding protein